MPYENQDAKEFKKPHRTTYDRLVEFLEVVSSGNEPSISNLSAAGYQNWRFGKELGFLESRDHTIHLTPLGERLLGASPEDRRKLFRSRLELAPSFSAIWNAILQWGTQHTSEIPRAEVARIVGEITQPKKEVMLNIYTWTILNWAISARLMEGAHGVKSETYRVIGPGELESPTDSRALRSVRDEEVHESPTADFLDKASLLVYDVIHRPGNSSAYLADLRRLSTKWIQSPATSGLSDDQKRIVLNELNYALETGGMRAFEMLAETLAILRGEKSRQMRIVEYPKERAGETRERVIRDGEKSEGEEK